MKKFLILSLLIGSSLVAKAGTTNTNFLWSPLVIQQNFGYDNSQQIFTNGLRAFKGIGLLDNSSKIKMSMQNDSFNTTITWMNTSNAFRLGMERTNGTFIGNILCISNHPSDKVFIYTDYTFTSNFPSLGTPNYPYELCLTNSLLVDGNPGITTNLNFAGITNTGVGGYKTNRLFFSHGILTNVINNF